MGSLIYWLFDTVISMFSLALIVYVVLSWLNITRNKWTELLTTVVEVVLNPIRTVLNAHLPTRWRSLDWSPVAAFLLIGLVRSLLKWVLM